MVNSLYFNSRYFFNKTGQSIQPEDLDSQLNNIVNYINDILIPAIETINFDATQGEGGSPFAVFSNISNQNVGYMYLNDLNIDDNLISLSKLEKITSGSVLGSTTVGEIFAITPTTNNQLLFIGAFLDPYGFDQENMSFRKIQSSDILPNTFTGQQLGQLLIDNFVYGAFTNAIADNSITINMLQQYIPAIKISNGAVDFNSLGVWDYNSLPYNIEIARQILLTDFEDQSITPFHLVDETIPWTAFNVFSPTTGLQAPINGVNIKPRSLVDDYFFPYNTQAQPPSYQPTNAQIKASNWGTIKNFLNAPIGQRVIVYNDLQLPAQKIALDSLGIGNFSQEIQDAMNRIINPPAPLPPPPPQIYNVSSAFYPISAGVNYYRPNGGARINEVRFGRLRVFGLQDYWWFVQDFNTNQWNYIPVAIGGGPLPLGMPTVNIPLSMFPLAITAMQAMESRRYGGPIPPPGKDQLK